MSAPTQPSQASPGTPDLPSLPFERGSHPLELAPLLGRLRAEGPVHRVRTQVGDEAWLVTGYEEVRQLLGDGRLGRSHPDPDNAPRANDSALFGSRPFGNYETEPQDHARFRSLLQPLFAPKRMRALRPRIEGLVTELLDDLEAQGPPADLQQALAMPLPVLVICELLGVPYEDRAKFRAYSEATAATNDAERSMAGLAELWSYMQRLIAGKRAAGLDPDQDVISELLVAADGTLDDDEIARLAAGLLFAGHETTVTQIGYGAVLLFTNPDHRKAVADDPGILTVALEESLRMANVSGTGGIPRYPRVDLEVGGVRIPAGDLMLLSIAAANHDNGVFTEPDAFAPNRREGAHVTFGHGSHYCLGAPLARIELHAVFSQLVPRFPTMRLAVPLEELRTRTDSLTAPLLEVPVTW